MNSYTDTELASFPWIISNGTLRSEDLIVSFWETAARLNADLSSVLSTLELLAGEDSRETDWNDELACETIQSLADILQDCAPAGFYFGSNEGDGACFGFWLSEDWDHALEIMGLADCDPSGWASLIATLAADGVEPDSIEDSYCGRADGYSEESAGADYALALAQETWLPESASRIGWNFWPLTCIDWGHAWRDLEMGDGYRLHDIGGGEWLVFRNC